MIGGGVELTSPCHDAGGQARDGGYIDVGSIYGAAVRHRLPDVEVPGPPLVLAEPASDPERLRSRAWAIAGRLSQAKSPAILVDQDVDRYGAGGAMVYPHGAEFIAFGSKCLGAHGRQERREPLAFSLSPIVGCGSSCGGYASATQSTSMSNRPVHSGTTTKMRGGS